MREQLQPDIESQVEKERINEIILTLRSHGINTLDAEDLIGRNEDGKQLMVVAHIKELPGDVESIGRECFGDKWQKGKWV